MNKPVLLLTLVLFCFATKGGFAQQMADMQGMDMQTHPKNVFLNMMDTMMLAMDNAPTGNSPSGIFMQQMIPHHRGAIAMSDFEITHGKNFEMIQLAKSIRAEQNSEITQMTLWLRQGHNDIEPVPDEFRQAMNKTMALMMTAMPNPDKLINTDKAFASVMIPHHQAAIDMAKVLLKYSRNETVNAYAKQLISAEKIEIEQMSTYIKHTSNEN